MFATARNPTNLVTLQSRLPEQLATTRPTTPQYVLWPLHESDLQNLPFLALMVPPAEVNAVRALNRLSTLDAVKSTHKDDSKDPGTQNPPT